MKAEIRVQRSVLEASDRLAVRFRVWKSGFGSKKERDAWRSRIGGLGKSQELISDL
jgi:hypothetical protein